MMRKDETVPEGCLRFRSRIPWQSAGVDVSVCRAMLGVTAGSCAEQYPDSEQYQQHQRSVPDNSRGIICGAASCRSHRTGSSDPDPGRVSVPGRDLQETAGSDGCEESHLVFSIDFCCRTWKHCTVFVCVRLRTDFVLCL